MAGRLGGTGGFDCYRVGPARTMRLSSPQRASSYPVPRSRILKLDQYRKQVLRVAYDEPSMVKADLIDRALDATDLERSAIRDAVDALFESVGSALERGDRVVLRRFGVFYPAPRKTGVARNPHTGEPVAIPRGRVVRFRSAPGLQSLPEGN